jgi:hypothetical protein
MKFYSSSPEGMGYSRLAVVPDSTSVQQEAGSFEQLLFLNSNQNYINYEK